MKDKSSSSVIRHYALIFLSVTALNCIYQSYYVELFLNIYHINERYFYIGQLLFAIWNALNDPLFGHYGDKFVRKGVSRGTQMKYGVPLLCVAFLAPLFPWSDNGESVAAAAHFVVSLFLWDAAFTWVVIHHCAMLPELTTVAAERARTSLFVSIATMLGTAALIPTFYIFDRDDLTQFRRYSILVAFISLCILYNSCNCIAQKLTKSADKLKSGDSEIMVTFHQSASQTLILEGEFTMTYFRVLTQIFKIKNFLYFVIVNFLNIFIVALFDSFKVTYIQYNVSPLLQSSHTLSSIYFSSLSIVPVVISPIVSSVGIYFSQQAYHMLRYTFVLRLIICGVSLTLYRMYSEWIPAVYLIASAVVIACVGRTLEIAVSDIVDEDYVLNKRSMKLSSSIYGNNALLTRPALSLAPSLGAYILGRYGYGQSGTTSGMLSAPLFYLFASSNFVCAGLQLFVWNRYSLHGDHLKDVKRLVHKKEDRNVV